MTNLTQRISSAEFLKAQQTVRKRAKFGNKITVVDGERFDSKGEAEHWQYLKLREAAGEIFDVRRQVRFPLFGWDGEPLLSDSGNQLVYVCDFVFYHEIDNKICREVVDFKGKDTPASALKRSVLAAMHKRRVLVVRKSSSRRRAA